MCPARARDLARTPRGRACSHAWPSSSRARGSLHRSEPPANTSRRRSAVCKRMSAHSTNAAGRVRRIQAELLGDEPTASGGTASGSVRNTTSMRTVPHCTAPPSFVAGRRFDASSSKALRSSRKNSSSSADDGSSGKRPWRAICSSERNPKGMAQERRPHDPPERGPSSNRYEDQLPTADFCTQPPRRPLHLGQRRPPQ